MAKRKKAAASSTPRAVGYVRVSTGKQALSPEAQEQRIRQMAALQGAELLELVVDKESAKEGSIHTRPGIDRILRLARDRKVDRIVIAKLDRLTRSVVDLGELLTELDRLGVALVSATETWMDTGSAAGRLVINIIVCVAQWEREAIAERTAAVLQYKRQQGQAYNHPPYGQARKGDRFVPVAAEQKVIARILEARKGQRTLRSIADELNEAKIPTKLNGGRWYASTVANVLRLAQ